MKIKLKTSFFLLIILFSFFESCKEDFDPIKRMEVTICGVKNPAWIKNEISLILNRSSHYIPIKISKYRVSDLEIISIEDTTNSNMDKSVMFFDCMGNKINFNSMEYNNYFQQFKNGKFILLWSN
ncbi:hypothetical protein [Petrimonas sp.]|uniref:hypothetical protein n=1 Tax=Petrimonas sp. TaxID=2023866 RepID=UPI003F519170